MITLLGKIFIKSDDISKLHVRSAYGVLCGIMGIVLNILLFAIKLLAGIISGSVAVMADAFNNLSDAGSSIINLIGFRLASQKADKDHPFGHGRYEYISGLIIAFLIFVTGFELIKTSIEKIITPVNVSLDTLTIIILCVSIVLKLYMAFYNRRIGKKINSSSMKATSTDSLSDSLATFVVLVCMLITHFTKVNIDGLCGLAVSVFIIIAGITAAKETINLILGQPPSKEFVEEIHGIVMSFPQILGIHDLIVHDYGPGRVMVSLHAEVSENSNLLETHDIIDNIEKYLCEKLNCNAVIHMDPIANQDEQTIKMRQDIASFIEKKFDSKLSIHDFRMVKGNTHTNVIFDVVVPYEVKITDEEIKTSINDYLSTFEKRYFAVITIDRSYI